MSSKKVFVVIGAGAGIGGHVGLRFAGAGYHVVFCRRSDQSGLDSLVQQVRDEGGSASGQLMNAAESGNIESLVSSVEAEHGPIEAALFNLGAQIGNRRLEETSYRAFEMGWRLATFGLFRFASVLLPRMAERQRGSLLVTSATAAVRGNAGQHSHAAAMGGRRMLCQTLNAEYAHQGVHVCNVLVDGAVDAPDTLGKMLGEEAFAKLRAAHGDGKDGLMLPEHMAETYYHLAHQHRSAWTHELDLRSHSDLAWWNH